MMRPLPEKGGIFLGEAIGRQEEKLGVTAERSIRIGSNCIGIIGSWQEIGMSFGGIF
jgi:hypothetical protein